MTFDDFYKKYNGKTIGFPSGKYVGECLSLVKQYILEVHNINPPVSGCNSARCYWSKFPSPLDQVFEKVPNTDDFTPRKGDIMVWNEKAGDGYGHIAICTGNNQGLKYFESFDQNWNGRQAHLVNHTYQNVYGVLRPKGDSMPSTGIVYENIEGYGPVDFGNEKQVEAFVKEFLKNIERITDARNQRDDYKTQLEVYKSEYEKEMKDIKATMAGLEESAKEYKNRYKNFISSVAKKLDTNQEEPAILAELTRLVVVEDDLVKAETKNAFLNEELDTRDEAIRRLKETLKDTQEQLKVAKGLKDATNSEIEREYWSRKIEFLTDFLQKLKNIVRK